MALAPAMAFNPTATLPLSSIPDAIFTDLWGSVSNTTQPSDTTAFGTGVDGHDMGVCVICGFPDCERTHIIPQSEPRTWDFMKGLGYVPPQAKSVAHESSNGICLCPNHCSAFDKYNFYIKWNSQTNEFIIVNHSQRPEYELIHGTVLHFNTNTRRCPFPTAFLWHEYRVRGFHPTCGDRTVILKRIRGGLQGRGVSGGPDGAVVHDDGRHDGGGDHSNGGTTDVGGQDDPQMETFTPAPMSFAGDEFSTWLKAAKQHSSWRDCVMENTSWSGTAEQNIEKYNHEVLPQLS